MEDAILNHGVDHQSAWEAVRRGTYSFRARSDEPNLNQPNTQPEIDPETTTESLKGTPSEAEAPKQSTVPMSPPSGS